MSEALYDVGPFSLVKMLSSDEVATIDYAFSRSSNSNKQEYESNSILICYNQYS